MKIRNDKDILRLLAISMVMMLAGMVLVLFEKSGFIGWGFILGGAIFTLMVIYIATRPKEEFIGDERSEKVMNRAGHHAFWILLNLVMILAIVDRFDILSIEFRDAGTLILFVGIYSFFILRWYYNKGENI